MERKCKSCGVWNADEQVCKSCGTVLDPAEIRKQEHKNEESKRAAIPKSKVEKMLDQMKASSNPLVKLSYVVLKTFWLVYMAIITFILWFIALGPG